MTWKLKKKVVNKNVIYKNVQFTLNVLRIPSVIEIKLILITKELVKQIKKPGLIYQKDWRILILI